MNLIEKFVTSIFRPSRYNKDFASDSVGKALVYLFIIAIVFSSFGLMKKVNDYKNFLSYLTEQIRANSPDFKFDQGQLEVDAKMPYMIESEEENSIFVIDTSGQIQPKILEDYNKGVLITKTRVVYKENKYETEQHSFAQFKELSFNKQDLINFIPALKWGSVLIVIFGFIFFVIGKLISALLLGVVGLLIKSIKDVDCGFGTTFKLSIYALTAPIIIKQFFNLLNVNLPFFFLIYYGLATFYLWQGLKSVAEAKQVEVKTEES